MILVFFLVTIIIGMLLLSVALIIGLGSLFGSFLYALICVGVIYMVVALLLYLLSLRQAIVSINQQLHTVYEISTMLERAYNRVKAYIEVVKSWL